jgi:hypothetical protein
MRRRSDDSVPPPKLLVFSGGRFTTAGRRAAGSGFSHSEAIQDGWPSSPSPISSITVWILGSGTSARWSACTMFLTPPGFVIGRPYFSYAYAFQLTESEGPLFRTARHSATGASHSGNGPPRYSRIASTGRANSRSLRVRRTPRVGLRDKENPSIERQGRRWVPLALFLLRFEAPAAPCVLPTNPCCLSDRASSL